MTIFQTAEKNIRTILINDSTIQSLLGCDSTTIKSRIRISHILTIENPIYPIITFFTPLGVTNPDLYTIESLIHLDIWGKISYDELHAIYSRVRELINLKPIDNIAQCRETGYNDNLYEPNTRTFHISAQYQIKALNN